VNTCAAFHEVLVRLSALDNGHRLPQKLLLRLMPLMSLPEPVDVLKVFMYRPEYYGRPFCDLAQILMRGQSEWTVGEREVFGAFTSKLNDCTF
jgi:hypothetical protein